MWVDWQYEQRTRRGRGVTVSLSWERIVRRRPNAHVVSRYHDRTPAGVNSFWGQPIWPPIGTVDDDQGFGRHHPP